MANWTSERIFFSGDEYLKDILKSIQSSEKSIDIEVYTFEPDEAGALVESALFEAAKRNVQVRLLIDGIGSLNYLGTTRPEVFQNSEHCDLRVYHPPPLVAALWNQQSLLKRLEGFIRGVAVLNRRTHRKLFIIDSHKAWVGSQNITRVSLEEFAGLDAWRETGICVEGDEIGDLSKAFDYAWERANPWGKHRDWLAWLNPSLIPLTSLVRLNHSLRRRGYLYRDLRRRVDKSKSRVWITSPYLMPPTRFISSLKKAKRRGVDVRLLVPSNNDVFFMRWVATSFYRTLLKSRIRIFEFQASFIHAKTMVIDDWATVGTSNLNSRSLRHDLEVDIAVTQASSVDKLSWQFEADMERSLEIKIRDTEKLRWLMMFGRWVTFFFKNWI